MKFFIPKHQDIVNRLAYPQPGKLRVVIDTDAYNEVDDQFAIAWALRSPERIDVEAVYAAPFCTLAFAPLLTGKGVPNPESMAGIAHFAATPQEGMQKSYDEIKKLYRLIGENPEEKVFRGSKEYLQPGVDPEPVESEAARDLVRRAMEGDQPLYVLAIGAITNIASAILMEPRITDKIVVVWLGGQPLEFPRTYEFNLTQDITAAQIVLDSGVPLVMVPCMGVASHLSTTAEELNARLNGKSKVGTYLAKSVVECFDDTHIPTSDKLLKKIYLAGLDDTPDEIADLFVPRYIAWSRIIWDISVVAYLLSPNWALTTLTSAPILTAGHVWQRDDSRHPVRICHYLSRNHIFGDLFAKLGNE